MRQVERSAERSFTWFDPTCVTQVRTRFSFSPRSFTRSQYHFPRTGSAVVSRGRSVVGSASDLIRSLTSARTLHRDLRRPHLPLLSVIALRVFACVQDFALLDHEDVRAVREVAHATRHEMNSRVALLGFALEHLHEAVV